MNKRRLNKLYELAEQLKKEYCEKFVLQDGNGSCCYDDGSNKVDFCPFSVNWSCAADDFMDVLDMIISLCNEEKKTVD